MNPDEEVARADAIRRALATETFTVNVRSDLDPADVARAIYDTMNAPYLRRRGEDDDPPETTGDRVPRRPIVPTLSGAAAEDLACSAAR